MHYRAIGMILLVGSAISGCGTEEEVKAQAIQQAKDHCESEGKQFVLVDVKQDDNANRTALFTKTTVVGNCVGPGQRGYVPTQNPAP